MVIAIAVSLGVGTLVGGWRARRAIVKPKEVPPPEPMDDSEYNRRRDFIIKQYHHGQDQFDRLIPWGAGGALLLSIGALEKLFPDPLPSTMWVLAVGWAALFGALASSIAGHYTSAQMYLADQQALDLAQKRDLSDDERVTYRRLTDKLGTLDLWTRLLNGTAIGGLLGGVLFLIAFAFANLGWR